MRLLSLVFLLLLTFASVDARPNLVRSQGAHLAVSPTHGAPPREFFEDRKKKKKQRKQRKRRTFESTLQESIQNNVEQSLQSIKERGRMASSSLGISTALAILTTLSALILTA